MPEPFALKPANLKFESSAVQALFPDAAATASYVDALAVVEFVNTFGKLWETQPISLSDLRKAVDSPADHPQLGELYPVLLSCVLLDQVCCYHVLFWTCWLGCSLLDQVCWCLVLFWPSCAAVFRALGLLCCCHAMIWTRQPCCHAFVETKCAAVFCSSGPAVLLSCAALEQSDQTRNCLSHNVRPTKRGVCTSHLIRLTC